MEDSVISGLKTHPHAGRVALWAYMVVSVCVLLLCVGCASGPHIPTAVGHSYDRAHTQDYISRDDDGDKDNVVVAIVDLTHSSSAALRVSHAIHKSEFVTHFISPRTAEQAAGDVRGAIEKFASIILIAVDEAAIAQMSPHISQWNDVLTAARSRGVPVVWVVQDSSDDNSKPSFEQISAQISSHIDIKFYAALWNVVDDQQPCAVGDKTHYSAQDAVMTIVNDFPHDTAMSLCGV